MTPPIAGAPLAATPIEDPGAEAQRILELQHAAVLRAGVRGCPGGVLQTPSCLTAAGVAQVRCARHRSDSFWTLACAYARESAVAPQQYDSMAKRLPNRTISMQVQRWHACFAAIHSPCKWLCAFAPTCLSNACGPHFDKRTNSGGYCDVAEAFQPVEIQRDSSCAFPALPPVRFHSWMGSYDVAACSLRTARAWVLLGHR